AGGDEALSERHVAEAAGGAKIAVVGESSPSFEVELEVGAERTDDAGLPAGAERLGNHSTSTRDRVDVGAEEAGEHLLGRGAHRDGARAARQRHPRGSGV